MRCETETCSPAEDERPVRDGRFARFVPLLVVLLAGGWVLGARHVADYVRQINAARAIAPFILGGSGGEDGPSFNLERLFMPGAQALPSTADHDPNRQTRMVELIVALWEKAAYGGAVVMVLGMLMARRWRRPRAGMLLAGTISLLGAAGSLIALRLLIHPSYGGLEDRPVLLHVLVFVVPALPGALLLVGGLRRTGCIRAVRPLPPAG